MDRINFSHVLNFHSPALSASVNEPNSPMTNAYITRLEAHHHPDESQKKNLSILLGNFCRSDSIAEVISLRKEILRELNYMRQEISDMRDAIFSISNENTCQVHGELNTHFTVNDRDQYIKKLMYYHEAEKKIDQMTHEHHNGCFFISVPSFHHTTALWGDMEALKRLIDGKYAKLPDLAYNLGELQYG